MDHEPINYSALVDEAMQQIVKKVIKRAEIGLPGEHHFYITFATLHPGVVLSKRLLERYPNEMTIVLQYLFTDLMVEESKFSVTLSFDGISERIVVPFKALTSFVDPSVNFGLQFDYANNVKKEDLSKIAPEIPAEPASLNKEPDEEPKENKDEEGKVVDFNKFRKKRKND